MSTRHSPALPSQSRPETDPAGHLPADEDEGSEVGQLHEVIRVLMDRVERGTSGEQSAFGAFETTIMLEDRVRRRTTELEAALRDNERITGVLGAERHLLAGVISAIPHLVYWKDRVGRYAGANAAFLARYGHITHEQLLGLTGAQLGVGGALAETLEQIETEVLQTGSAVIDRHVHLTAEDGKATKLLISVLPEPGADGRPEGLIGVGADVSQLAELEKQLAQAQRLEAVGQLAAGIAHEINTPVQFVSDNTRFVAESFATMLPCLQLLAELNSDPTESAGRDINESLRARIDGVDLAFLLQEIPTALEESLEGLDRVAKIVLAMKDFSHPGQAVAEADLNRAVSTSVQVSRNEWKYVAELSLDLDPDIGVVRCHEGDIKQVLLNMIVNAAHAIQERCEETAGNDLGNIRISTHHLDSAVQIVIADDGRGMDRATQDRIFDPFFTTKEVGKGTGQGLSLARSSIVQKHGGTITVDSALGVGTTFTITIPLAPPAATGTDSDVQGDRGPELR